MYLHHVKCLDYRRTIFDLTFYIRQSYTILVTTCIHAKHTQLWTFHDAQICSASGSPRYHWDPWFTKPVLMLACSGKSLQLILNFCCSNTHIVKWFQFISGVCMQVYC